MRCVMDNIEDLLEEILTACDESSMESEYYTRVYSNIKEIKEIIEERG